MVKIQIDDNQEQDVFLFSDESLQEHSADSALHIALKCKQLSSRRRLVERLVEFCPRAAYTRDEEGCLPLHLAILIGAPGSSMEVLLRAYPGSAREMFPDGSSPLQWALATGASEEVLFLLLDANRGAARGVCKEGSGTLHLAVRQKFSVHVVSSLLQVFPEGAQHADKDGRIPLHVAARHAAALDVVELLLRAFPRGARQRDHRRLLPLHLALEHNASERIVAMLVQSFPKGVQMKNERGEFPLHAAARSDAPEHLMVKLYDAYPRGAAGLPDEVRLRVKQLAKQKSFISADVPPREATKGKHDSALKKPQCNLHTEQDELDRREGLTEGLTSRMRRIVADRISGSSTCSLKSRDAPSLKEITGATSLAASTSASLRDCPGTQVLQCAKQAHIQL